MSKPFIYEDENTCRSMQHVPKVKANLPAKKYYSISFCFNPVKFQESNYRSQIVDISLFKDI